jgi:hypothetical protein
MLALAGCTHQTAIVTEQDLTKTGAPITELKGIPFYSKKGVCNKESVWLEPQYTLTLTVVADGNSPLTRTMVLSRYGYEGSDTRELLQLLAGLKGLYKLSEIVPNSCPAAIGAMWDPISRNLQYSVVLGLDSDDKLLREAEAKHNVLLVSNKAEIGAATDYSHRDYLNTLSPWNGSSQVDAKLAADGTLTEGSVQRDDETLNTILTSITSLVGDFTGASAAAAAAPPAAAGAQPRGAAVPIRGPRPSCLAYNNWPGVSKDVKYTYSLKTMIYSHDHKMQTDLHGNCSLAGDRVWGGNFTVSVEDGSGSAKNSDKAIQFSGQVKLPDAKKKDDKKQSD